MCRYFVEVKIVMMELDDMISSLPPFFVALSFLLVLSIKIPHFQDNEERQWPLEYFQYHTHR